MQFHFKLFHYILHFVPCFAIIIPVIDMEKLLIPQEGSSGSIFTSPDLKISRQFFPKPDPAGVNRSAIHTHSNCEILWVLKGAGFIHIEGNRYPLQPGSFYITRPGEYHNVEMDSAVAYDRAVIYFSPALFSSMDPEGEFLRPFTERPPGKLNHYVPPEQTDIRYLLPLLDPTTSRSDRLLILLRLLQSLAQWRKKVPGQEETQEYQIIQHINNHLDENLSVPALCQRFFISRTQLYRRLEHVTGMSVGEYVTVRRLMAAQELLFQGMRPTEVYSACGFRDYSTFYRAYRKHFKKSPSSL